MVRLSPLEVETVLKMKHTLLNMAQNRSMPLKLRDVIVDVLTEAIKEATIDVQDFAVRVSPARESASTVLYTARD